MSEARFSSDGERTFRSGYVSIAGEPNVGKSTFLNKVLERKVSIVSEKVQTTRKRVLGILHLWPGRRFRFLKTGWTHGAGQIIFIDTPGIWAGAPDSAASGRSFFEQNPRTVKRVEEALIDEARKGILDADCLFWFFDIKKLLKRINASGPALLCEEIERFHVRLRKPIVLVLNKADQAKKGERDEVLRVCQALTHEFEWCRFFIVSSKSGEGIGDLIRGVFETLAAGPAYYPKEMVSDQSHAHLFAEFIREKVYRLLYREVPYSVHVNVDAIEDRTPPASEQVDGEKMTAIFATIYVERESQKGILIGNGARTLKQIGIDSRREIEGVLGGRIFLDLVVKVKKDWSRDEKMLKRFGYIE